MTCDEYFDYLTSAAPPGAGDSTAASDSPAARDSAAAHLTGCARCRSLAETLEPALDLFRAAAVKPRSEPAARGRSEEEDVPAWLLAAMDEADRDPPVQALPFAFQKRPSGEPSSKVLASNELPSVRMATSRRGLTWSALAAMLLGLLVGGAVWGVSAANQRGASVQGEFAWPPLSAIQLSPACLAPRDNSTVSPPGKPASSPPGNALALGAMAQADRDNLNCCTSCHALGRAAAAACDARLLAVSCQACHAR